MAKYLFSANSLLLYVLFLRLTCAYHPDSYTSTCVIPFDEFRGRNPFNRTIGYGFTRVEEDSQTKNQSYVKNHIEDASGKRFGSNYSRAEVLSLVQNRRAFPNLPALPPFAPVHTAAGEMCRNHSKIFLKEIQELKMWALKMYDASAKIPSGLLNGNVNQYGDFDECIKIDEVVDQNIYSLKDGHIQGKYCMSYIDVKAHDPQNLELLDLLQSHYMIRSNLSDPGHRLPRLSSINWGFCVPSSCSAKDLEVSVNDVVDNYVSGFDLKLSVTVNPEMCYTKHSWKEQINAASIFCFLLLASLFALIFFATATERISPLYWDRKGWAWKVTNSFSLRRNCTQLMSTSAPADDIKCIHGIRFLNAIALLLCHKSMSLLYNPFVNRTAMTEALSYRWTVIARTAIIYTDSFIMVSGILAAYGFIKDLDKEGKLDVMKKYVNRVLRITPNFLAIILLCTYIIVPLGSGPLWNLVVKHHSDLCKSYMWRNILYIHNYFGFEDMCLTHTHQLGLDMQLFLVSPLIIYLLWRWTEAGFIACMMLGFISTGMRYIVTYEHQLSPLIYFGASVSQLFATATNSYILPTHRLTSYLIGIGVGFYLRRMEKEVTLSKFQVFIGWSVSLAMGIWAMMGPTQITDMNYVYKEHDAAFYMAFSPIMWCCFIAWTIYATSTGYGGFFGDFLSWKGFVVFTRIAYALYLVQFPIFFYNVGRKRSAESYDLTAIFNIAEMLAVFIASIALTMIVDLPAQNLRKTFFPETRQRERNEDARPSPEVEAIEKNLSIPGEVINGTDTRRRAVG
ncbi:nose resistant to fluoxetine protein 6-like [Ischnura elegans]|uniref:nose resistant to fluoxetine protein 6-like n=1 Tax=Ischnura elegans TaxID=197161 RepID=UPI001ED8920C|nr:nose resistant to fluoxetine protein 6-like [Ischnura elegans]